MPVTARPIDHDDTAVVRVGRWAAAMALTGARYAIHRVPLYRRDRDHEAEGPALPDFDRDLPGDPATVQRASSGLGPVFHRSYRIAVTDEELGPEALIDAIAADPEAVTPTEMARFRTVDGGRVERLEVGDELVVRLPGPWDGPVRVIDRTPTSFRFVTLAGHMEAGEIQFAARHDDRGFLEFRIDSWARSGDRVFHLLYERFPVGREMQLHMWSQFCQRVAATSGGVRMSNVSCTTERHEAVDA